jgi:hypothetical protein
MYGDDFYDKHTVAAGSYAAVKIAVGCAAGFAAGAYSRPLFSST